MKAWVLEVPVFDIPDGIEGEHSEIFEFGDCLKMRYDTDGSQGAHGEQGQRPTLSVQHASPRLPLQV